MELARKRQDAELRQREAQSGFVREQRRMDGDLELDIRRRYDLQQQQHAVGLRDMGVDLTAYLTQARADQIIELRGGGNAHVHVDQNRHAEAKPETA